MSNTTLALIARGLDRTTANNLTTTGWTVAKLKQAKDSRLQKLGLTALQIVALKDGTRPPIPSSTLHLLLFKSRYQCCVCRDPKLPIIIHHIVEWSKSKSHDYKNLAVLCLNHHDQAHAVSTLRRNLTAADLRKAKSNWEKEVEAFDARSIVDALKADGSQWAYINELRVFELIGDYRIDTTQSLHFPSALAAGVVDRVGYPRPTSTRTYYKYEGPNIQIRYAFMKDALQRLVDKLPVTNISDYLDRGVLIPALVLGDFIFVEGAHVFKRLTTKRRGIGQICRGKRSANKVDVKYTFDRWEATSSSAMSVWLSGKKNAGSLLHVKSLSRKNNTLVIEGTVLAISSFTSQLKKREYAARWINWRPKRRRITRRISVA